MECSNYQAVERGIGRECVDRLALIAPLIPPGVPLSILDVGSNMGYFSRELARDRARLVVSVEMNQADAAYHLARLRADRMTNNVVLPVALDMPMAALFAESPVVFDYALLLSVVHFFWHPFERWARHVIDIVRSARNTIFELYSDEEPSQDRYSRRFARWYARYPRRPYESLLREVLARDPEGRYTIRFLGKVRWMRHEPRPHRPLLLVTNTQPLPASRTTLAGLNQSPLLQRVVDHALRGAAPDAAPRPTLDPQVRRFLGLALGLAPATRHLLPLVQAVAGPRGMARGRGAPARRRVPR